MFSLNQADCIRCYFDPLQVGTMSMITNSADVYFAETTDLAGIYSGLKQYLGKEELARADRFVYDKDRSTYVSCHAILRLILAKRLRLGPLDISFINGVYNKPKLPGDPLFFNITHTVNAFAVVIADNFEAGIDMESVNRTMNYNGIIGNFFSESEGKYIRQIPEEENSRFYKLWTRKEALLKALGTGIADNLPGVEVSGNENYIRKESFESLIPESALKEYYIYSFMYQNYFLSIAAPCKTSINFIHLRESNINSFFQ